MSAFVVSTTHIDALLTCAYRHVYANGEHYDLRRVEDATTIGRILLAENIRSVTHRYPQDAHPDPTTYHFTLYPHYPMSSVAALKLVDCLAYQSNESDDWEQTEAHKILNQLTAGFIRALPGYDAAPWGVHDSVAA